MRIAVEAVVNIIYAEVLAADPALATARAAWPAATSTVKASGSLSDGEGKQDRIGQDSTRWYHRGQQRCWRAGAISDGGWAVVVRLLAAGPD